MAKIIEATKTSKGNKERENTNNTTIQILQYHPQDCQELIRTLPKETFMHGIEVYKYQGYWYSPLILMPAIAFQRHFQARDSDLILVTSPKSGTTWLKALSFTIANRTKYPLSQSPLLSANPHDLVPLLEDSVYVEDSSRLEGMSRPRLLSTHMAYSQLPISIKDSKCRVVYLCRNPLDQFISYWKFLQQILPEGMDPISIDETFDMFCRGVHAYGPFWDHSLGYWKASQEMPEKLLFLKYEDMKEDMVSHVKKLAEFLGLPFSVEEEQQGLIKEISKFCSFENMRNLEVSKNGHRQNELTTRLNNSAYFRKGKIGDWANYLTPSMEERIKKVMEEKFGSSGLTFKVSAGC